MGNTIGYTRKQYIEMQAASGLQVGDKVKLLRKGTGGELGWGDTWVSSMSDKIGEVFTISSLDGRGLRLKETGLNWPFFVFETVEPSEPETVTVICEGKETTISRESAQALNLI